MAGLVAVSAVRGAGCGKPDPRFPQRAHPGRDLHALGSFNSHPRHPGSVLLCRWGPHRLAPLRKPHRLDLLGRRLPLWALTAMLALVYFGGVATTQAIFRALTSQEQPQLAIVVSTLVIAALFNPLRHRIQSFIDGRFYRRKYDARKMLEGFALKLRDETDLEALSEDLVGVVRETMQPAHVSLWLRSDTTSQGVAD